MDEELERRLGRLFQDLEDTESLNTTLAELRELTAAAAREREALRSLLESLFPLGTDLPGHSVAQYIASEVGDRMTDAVKAATTYAMQQFLEQVHELKAAVRDPARLVDE